MSTDQSRRRIATTLLPLITSELKMDKVMLMLQLTKLLMVVKLKEAKRLLEQDLPLLIPVLVTVTHQVKLLHKVSGAHTTLNNVRETLP